MKCLFLVQILSDKFPNEVQCDLLDGTRQDGSESILHLDIYVNKSHYLPAGMLPRLPVGLPAGSESMASISAL